MGRTRRAMAMLAGVVAVATVAPVAAGAVPDAVDERARSAANSSAGSPAAAGWVVGDAPFGPPVRHQETEEAGSGTPVASESASGQAPVLGADFEMTAERLGAGVARVDWDDVSGAGAYELMALADGEWLLLVADGAVGGVSAHFDGSSAVVAGLAEPPPAEGWWFTVRARNTSGVSEWSPSVRAAVAAEPAVLFDPFTAPTRSGIDLENLREAVATVDTASDCDSAPALDVEGITVVEAPAGLDDPDADLTVAEVVRIAGGCVLVEYAELDGRSIAAVRTLLAADPSVLAVGEPARGLRLDHDAAGNDDDSAHYDDGGGAQWHLTPDVADLWAADWSKGADITVAVLDSGVDNEHPDLADAVVATAAGCDVMDANGHGTAVAGVIAAKRDKTAAEPFVAGVAPQARIRPIRVKLRDQVCTIGGVEQTLPRPPQAIAQAVNGGVRLINMSFSGTKPYDVGLPDGVAGIGIPSRDAYGLTIRAAAMLGAVMVAAAGNCGDDRDSDNDGVPNWQEANSSGRPRCGMHNQRRRPAQYPGVISVAAVNHNGIRRASSTANADVSVAAPGGKLLSTVPLLECSEGDVDGDGRDEWLPLGCGTDPDSSACQSLPTPSLHTNPESNPGPCANRVALKSGTSFAAPFVSGVVAHMLNRHPEASVGQVRAALEGSARHPSLGRGQRDDEYGFGVVDPAGAVGALGRALRSDALSPEGEGRAGGGFSGVSAGGSHSCGTRSNGRVRCWGGPASAVGGSVPDVAFAQVSASPGTADVFVARTQEQFVEDEGETEDFDADVEAARVAALNVPYGFGCGVRRGDGAVNCWGDRHPLMGAVSAVSADPAAPKGRFEHVTVGNAHACGLRPGGRVVCWGDPGDARTDVPADSFGSASAPRLLFSEIAAGPNHTCGLSTPGAVVCWGYEGPMDAEDGRVVVPAVLRSGGSALSVSAGGAHSCAVRSDRSVLCWGDNASGQTDAPSGEFRSVSAGLFHTCGLRTNGRVACWGDNARGKSDAPEGAFVAVSAGASHSCAIRAMAPMGGVVCWGDPSGARLPVPELAALGLRVTEGTERSDVLAGVFDPAVAEYVVGTRQALATVAARPAGGEVGFASVVDISPEDALPDTGPPDPEFELKEGHQVRLGAGATVTVTVTALDGFGSSKTYTIEAAQRLTSLSVRAETGEADCPGAGCPPYALVPAFDAESFAYETVVPADVALATIAYNAAGAAVAVSPADAVPPLSANEDPTPGHQLALSTDRDFSSVSAGGSHSCGVKAEGSVVCWGDALSGRLAVPSGSFAGVSAGDAHACGVKTDQSVVCWGSSTNGRTAAPSGSFDSVSAGGSHSCGVKADESVVCWGSNSSGQRAAPSGSFESVSAGGSHACGVKTDSSVVCWGSNSSGQRAAPSGSFESVSAGRSHTCGVKADESVVCWGSAGSVPSGSFSSVSAGRLHTCGVKTDGSVRCWGFNTSGQTNAPSGSFSSVSAGGSHTCGVRTDGSAVCWGSSGSGQADAPSGAFAAVSAGWSHTCGIKSGGSVACWGDAGSRRTTGPAGSFSSLSAGRSHTCAVKADSSVACWGSNSSGQSSAPSGAFASVSAGRYHSCGVKADRSVACWGSSGGSRLEAPAGSFASVSASSRHSCALNTDKTVACWGFDGSGRADAPEGSFAAVSAGGSHTCALEPDGTAVCWGDNSYGQSDAPAGSFASVSAGESHTCGVRADQSVVCWGDSLFRQSDAPAGSFVSVSAGGFHTCGVRPDSSVVCWGARNAALEPAKPERVTLQVAGPPGTPKVVYTVDVQRPNPASASAGASAGAGSEARGVADPVGSRAAEASSSDTQSADLVCPSGPSDTGDDDDGSVVISDDVLRTAVLDALGKSADDSVTRSELGMLTALSVPAAADAPRVASLSGLEHASGLSSLDLTGHEVSDIAALGCLSGLTSLELGGNDVADLSPLTSLTALESLGLSGNAVTDLSPLAGLTSLEALDVSHNEISGVAGLSGLAALRVLNAGGNDIADLSPLSALSGLEALYGYGNEVADVTAVAALTDLEVLHLDHNAISDVTSLSGLTELRVLGLGGNDIADVAALGGLVSLEDLYLFDNGIVELDPLGPVIAGARSVWLSGNRIAAPGRVPGLPRYEYLDIRYNELVDVGGPFPVSAVVHTLPQRDTPAEVPDETLAAVIRDRLGLGADEPILRGRLAALRELRYRGSDTTGRIASLAGLEHAANLANLDLSGNRVTDITPITGLDGLRSLNLAGNGFTDLAQLASLDILRNLDLSANGIASLDALPALTALESLSLNRNSTTSIVSLSQLGALRWLQLDHNTNTDLTPLSTLSRLELLRITDNDVTDLSPLRDLANLRNLYIARNRITDLTALDTLTGLTIHGHHNQRTQ